MKAITPLMMIRAGEPMILAVDASSYGLGAALFQKDVTGVERPVFFASRLLNEAEKDYPQLDKEFLAVVWALERLDAFVYGQVLTVRTDHRPLLGLIKKQMAHLSTRQQRFVARTMRYSFSLEFVPGREMVIADFLSRAVDKPGPECRCRMMGTDIRLEDAFVSMISTTQIADELVEKIRTDIQSDEKYKTMLQLVLTTTEHAEASQGGEYWASREGYAVEDGLLFFQGRMVIPRAARPRVIESLHRGHVALATMKKRAEHAVWWPGIVNDLKLRAQRCGDCHEELPMQPREPMVSFEVPSAPGIVVHADNFELAAKEYLMLTDGFSGWTEVFTSSSRRPSEVMRLMRAYMSRHGVPRQFHSDQGSAFISVEFREFCKKWGIKATTGSAKHPRGNAIAEASVKKVKKLLRTAKDDDELAMALLAFHQTPVAPGRPSPAQLHYGRNLRDELHPKVQQANIGWTEVREWKMAVAAERKTQFDRGTRPLPPLKNGDLVLVRHNDSWQRGWVVQCLDRPRSYIVKLEKSGQQLQRNRHLLRLVDQSSGKPCAKEANPDKFFQARTPRAPVRLLSPTIVQLPLTQPGTDPSTPPGHDAQPTTPDVNPQQNQDSSPRQSPTPVQSRDDGDPHSPPQSSRSSSSLFQSPRSTAEWSEDENTLDPLESGNSSEDSESQSDDDGRDPESGNSGPPQPRDAATTVTRAGRPSKAPNRYSPSQYDSRRRR
jgi:transposase InsO family protein